MEMLHGDDRIDIRPFRGHYIGVVKGKIVVCGDTWNEVYQDLLEMGYLE